MAFGEGVEVFALSNEKALSQAFEAHAFHAVVFLATRGEQLAGLVGEADLLSGALALAKRHDVPRVVCVTSGELNREKDALGERGLLLSAMEQLCAAYRVQGLSVTILRLPLVFGPGETDTFIGRMMAMAARGETAVIPYALEARADFICAAEVSQLVSALLDREEPPEDLLLVRGAETLTIKELAALFGLLGARVSCGENEVGCPPVEGAVLAESCGFVPITRLSVEMDSLFAAAKAAHIKQQGTRGRARAFFARHPAVVKATSLVLGYGALEGLKVLQDAGALPAMDLSLLYVALIGAAHGLQTGMYAVILACFSLAFQYGARGADIRALLGDYTAWLPFLTIILAGAACGYGRDRGFRAARLAREDAATLAQRCDFLQELYKQQLLTKGKPSLSQEAEKERPGEQFAQPILAEALPQSERAADMPREEADTPQPEPCRQKQPEPCEQEQPEEAPPMSEQERLHEIRVAHKKAEESRRAEQARLKQVLADLQMAKPSSEHFEPFEPSKPYEEAEDTLTIVASPRPEEVPEEPEAKKEQGSLKGRREETKPLPAPNPVPAPERRTSKDSPFSSMSPSERRRMLEAMQVRARARAAGKGR
jgi:hypothetical protein